MGALALDEGLEGGLEGGLDPPGGAGVNAAGSRRSTEASLEAGRLGGRR